MKPYVGYSSGAGSREGAILIFANNAKEAKRIGWKAGTFIHELCDDEYTDFRVRLIKNNSQIFEEKVFDKPHVIEFPRHCKNCGLWGKVLGADGFCFCENCQEVKDEKK